MSISSFAAKDLDTVKSGDFLLVQDSNYRMGRQFEKVQIANLVKRDSKTFISLSSAPDRLLFLNAYDFYTYNPVQTFVRREGFFGRIKISFSRKDQVSEPSINYVDGNPVYGKNHMTILDITEEGFALLSGKDNYYYELNTLGFSKAEPIQ